MDYKCSHQSAEVTMHQCRQNVKRHGWNLTGVLADHAQPGFAYTTGLTESYGHPELVVAALPLDSAHGVISAAVEALKTSGPLAPGRDYDRIAAGFPVRFRDVDLTACTLSFSVTSRFYNRPVKFMQLVWPDPAGRFPGDPECDAAMAMAQRIGELWPS